MIGEALSWRDVYYAVGESEDRVVKTIETLEKQVRTVIDDHEDRIRELEASKQEGSGQTKGVSKTLKVEHLVLVALGVIASLVLGVLNLLA